MRSELFDTAAERQSGDLMSVQNKHMLRVRLDGAASEVLARQGSMVAYQGQVDFAYQGAGGLGRFLKKAVTGEGLPLMRVSGAGDVFLADEAGEVHLLSLHDESLTVNGRNVLAFDPALSWDIRRVEGVSMVSGGLFNTVFTGSGQIAVTALGTPVVLQVDAPTFADPQALVCWSSSLSVQVRRTAGVGALVGRGSGEAFQLGFSGTGFVVVQASEGPTVPPHSH